MVIISDGVVFYLFLDSQSNDIVILAPQSKQLGSLRIPWPPLHREVPPASNLAKTKAAPSAFQSIYGGSMTV